MGERPAGQDLPGKEVPPVRAEPGPRQDLLPPESIARQRFEVLLVRSRPFEGRALRVVALEVVGVDLDPLEEAGRPESQDQPVVAGTAAAAGLPAVPHVRGAARHDQVVLGAEVHVARAEDEPAVPDGGQIQQAIIVLATNGIDAMPDGGTLTFRVFTKGSRVAIEVADSGTGIDPENMSKVFEPFYTTKEVGQGTGLGLAVCYGIISEHGGRISVRSNLGKGTTFSIFLPITQV